MDKGGKFYGIDFGTTNTTMVCYDSNDDRNCKSWF